MCTDSLLCQYIMLGEEIAHLPSIESQIGEAHHTHDITILDAEVLVLCHKTLKAADDATTHYHHDKKTGAVVGTFTETCNSERKDTWPQRRAEKPDTDKGISTEHAA